MPLDYSACVDLPAAVAQAVANLRARGVEPAPAVIALYEQYAAGHLSRQHVVATMQERARRIQPAVGPRIAGCLDLGLG